MSNINNSQSPEIIKQSKNNEGEQKKKPRRKRIIERIENNNYYGDSITSESRSNHSENISVKNKLNVERIKNNIKNYNININEQDV